MTSEEELLATATAVRRAIGMAKRRTRERIVEGLSLPETAVMSRLDRNGPDSIAGLARWEQITPQAMGSTVAGLESRGLIRRIPDPDDKRRFLFSLTKPGLDVLHNARDQRTRQFAAVLAEHFTADEIADIRKAAPLIEKLAQLL